VYARVRVRVCVPVRAYTATRPRAPPSWAQLAVGTLLAGGSAAVAGGGAGLTTSRRRGRLLSGSGSDVSSSNSDSDVSSGNSDGDVGSSSGGGCPLSPGPQALAARRAGLVAAGVLAWPAPLQLPGPADLGVEEGASAESQEQEEEAEKEEEGGQRGTAAAQPRPFRRRALGSVWADNPDLATVYARVSEVRQLVG
jgi:hypothetical protein